ncbi:hypothetical protein CQ12_33610 [Bradyrhizobium jicamae]|uniref:Uncharacterized protein n=1 Tax=Bradyrhizobium jicamae TaxID=280332 RepID=A0A0R3LL45_9BRAD|nr:hypothetical protein CQ12_33610 [Bradyrhizobium jicamae]
MTFLAWERRIDRDRLQEFLVRFYETRPAEDGDQAWAGWLQAIALTSTRTLPAPNVRPMTSIGSRRSTLGTSRMCSIR